MSVTGGDRVRSNLLKWGVKLPLKMLAIADTVIVPMLEDYAKSNRPWTDRTGLARRSLKGRAVLTADELAIQIHHGVEYGLYLEMSRSGKFAILMPTIDKNKDEIIRKLKEVE